MNSLSNHSTNTIWEDKEEAVSRIFKTIFLPFPNEAENVRLWMKTLGKRKQGVWISMEIIFASV